MHSHYLGKIPFTAALKAQQTCARDTILGFEPQSSVITLGRRALADVDVIEANAREIVMVDRGGQATLHNPGQLVIFPVCLIPCGVREWVRAMADATIGVAADLDMALEWRDDHPGLYDEAGAKVAAIGIRVREGISTHGLALNVRNDLSEFAAIRACGQASAKISRLNRQNSLEEIFKNWVTRFHAEVDKTRALERC